MPWEIAVHNANRDRMGSREEIGRRLSATLPNLQWHTETVEPEFAMSISDEVLRQSLLTPHLLGYVVDGQVGIEIHGFEPEPITSLLVDVRGSGDPIPLLAAICRANDWIVTERSTNRVVDVVAGDRTSWLEFQGFLDEAVRQTLGKEPEDNRLKI